MLPSAVHLVHRTVHGTSPSLIIFANSRVHNCSPTCVSAFLHHHNRRPNTHIHTIARIRTGLHKVGQQTEGHIGGHLLTVGSSNDGPSIRRATSATSAASALICSAASSPRSIPAALSRLVSRAHSGIHHAFTNFLNPIVRTRIPFTTACNGRSFRYNVLTSRRSNVCHRFPNYLGPISDLRPNAFTLPVRTSSKSKHMTVSIVVIGSNSCTNGPRRGSTRCPTCIIGPHNLSLTSSSKCNAPDPRTVS